VISTEDAAVIIHQVATIVLQAQITRVEIIIHHHQVGGHIVLEIQDLITVAEEVAILEARLTQVVVMAAEVVTLLDLLEVHIQVAEARSLVAVEEIVVADTLVADTLAAAVAAVHEAAVAAEEDNHKPFCN
jgi:hypothetical protein